MYINIIYIAYIWLDTNMNARYEYEYTDGYEYVYELIKTKRKKTRNIGKKGK